MEGLAQLDAGSTSALSDRGYVDIGGIKSERLPFVEDLIVRCALDVTPEDEDVSIVHLGQRTQHLSELFVCGHPFGRIPKRCPGRGPVDSGTKRGGVHASMAPIADPSMPGCRHQVGNRLIEDLGPVLNYEVVKGVCVRNAPQQLVDASSLLRKIL